MGGGYSVSPSSSLSSFEPASVSPPFPLLHRWRHATAADEHVCSRWSTKEATTPQSFCFPNTRRTRTTVQLQFTIESGPRSRPGTGSGTGTRTTAATTSSGQRQSLLAPESRQCRRHELRRDSTAGATTQWSTLCQRQAEHEIRCRCCRRHESQFQQWVNKCFIDLFC